MEKLCSIGGNHSTTEATKSLSNLVWWQTPFIYHNFTTLSPHSIQQPNTTALSLFSTNFYTVSTEPIINDYEIN